MRVRVTGGDQGDAARVATALLAGGLEIAGPDSPYDLMLTLGDHSRDRVQRGCLMLDYARRRASVAGVAVPLTPIEFALLECLARLDRPVSRGELLREVWGYRFDPGSNAVAVHVSRLRAKIGRNRIATDRDCYRLVTQPIESAPPR